MWGSNSFTARAYVAGVVGCSSCACIRSLPVVGGGCGCVYLGLGIIVLWQTSTLSGSRSTPCERPLPSGWWLPAQPAGGLMLLVWVVCGGLFVICIVVASIFVLYCFLCFV